MEDEIRRRIQTILAENRTMTIATIRPDGWPQATTVGFVADDLTLYFLCGPTSQKAANIARDDRVSVTIDRDVADVMAITGLSMAARAAEVTDSTAKARILAMLVERYPPQPNFGGAMPSPDSIAVFRLAPIVMSVLDYSRGFGHTDLVWP